MKTKPYSGKLDRNDQDVEIAELKSDIKWIRIIGSSVIAASLLTLSYLIQFEIPKQITAASSLIDGQLPNNFSERFSKLEQKIDDLQSRYGGITPSSLLTLVPGHGEKLSPIDLEARLQKADHVIDDSYDLDLPGNPVQLIRVSSRLENIRDEYAGEPSINASLMSAQAHLASYSHFSAGAYGTNLSLHTPSRTQSNGINSPLLGDRERTNGVSVIGNLTIECRYNTAGAIGGDPEALSNVFVFQVRIRNCQQRQLAYLTWVRAEFDHATVMYNGGPLTLVENRFENCVFDFGNDSNSKKALAIINASEGKPVSIYLR